MRKIPLSVIVPVKNEAANLARCLQSVAWADQVFVVDSNSTDATGDIAREHGAEVVQFAFNGRWPKKKNWALETLPFKHPWILILDADEELLPDAEGEIDKIVSDLTNTVNGYWINRRFMFMGDWLRHAYYPNWNLRLFRHNAGRYEKLTDSITASGDNEVHEHVVVNGSTARLTTEMNHYAFPSVEVFIEKHNRYSNWEARVEMDTYLSGSASTLQMGNVGGRRRLKKISHQLPFRPLMRFCYVYFWQLGVLDGIAGYHFARLHALYEYLCVVKTCELKIQAKAAEKPPLF